MEDKRIYGAICDSVASDREYPQGYKGPKTIAEQARLIGTLLELEYATTLSFAEGQPQAPEGAEGWFVVPKISAVAKKHFPSITDPAQQYCEAILLAVKKLKTMKYFERMYNWHDRDLSAETFRQKERTLQMMARIEAAQSEGDLFFVPAQLGLKHRGKSVEKAEKDFSEAEFGLGAFACLCIAMAHEQRFASVFELGMNCAGDEFFTPDRHGIFPKVPNLAFYENKTFLGANIPFWPSEYLGSATGFMWPELELV